MFLFWRSASGKSPETLVATAYSEQRTLELRIARSQHSEMRVRRGQDTYPMGRPQSLLEAEAAIARGLRAKPEDPRLLAARGSADLLEWSYEAAITDMQQALDTQVNSPAVLNGLATAYFERAEAESRFGDMPQHTNCKVVRCSSYLMTRSFCSIAPSLPPGFFSLNKAWKIFAVV